MKRSDMAARIRCRIQTLHDVAPDSVGDQLGFRLLDAAVEQGRYTLSCSTAEWMRNPAGTLHGGMCATIADQAMGLIAYCIKEDDLPAPAIQLQVNYLRPVIPGEQIQVHVHVVAMSRRMITLGAQVFHLNQPDRICVNATGVYFRSEKKSEK